MSCSRRPTCGRTPPSSSVSRFSWPNKELLPSVLFGSPCVQSMRCASGRYFPMLFNSDGALMSSQAIIASKLFYEAGHATMQPFFEEARSRGELPADLDLDDFIEWHLRLVFSFAMFDSPAPRDQASLSRLLETFIVPPLTASPGD